jgi:ABC-2 type transport system permease protein
MSTANETLQPVTSRGWQRGFANLLDHEHHLWWGRRKWLVQLLIWILLINGSVASIGIGINSTKDAINQAEAEMITPEKIYLLVMQVFFQAVAICTSVGAVISAQGTIIQEKQLGTAAWILSKPVSRSAFVLAKLIANTFAFLVLAVVAPTIIFYGEIYLFASKIPALPNVLAGVSIWSLLVLFYLTLTIMLGTFFNARGAVLGIALGFMFAGNILPNVLPDAAVFFPWILSEVALVLALGPSAPQPLPPTAVVPVIATSLWIVVFVVLSIWRFGREEF